jgi:hypothetical protein
MLTKGISHHIRDSLPSKVISTIYFQGEESLTMKWHESDLRRVADWLTPINFRAIQSDTFSKHTPGTGTWFIDHPQFQEWLSGNNQVLWVEGMRKYLTYLFSNLTICKTAGSGKTVLASVLFSTGPFSLIHSVASSSIVTDHLQALFSDDHDIAAVFAYCRYKDRYPLAPFLASFIKQLVEHHPRFFPYIESVYTKHMKEATRPHEQNLLELFQKLIGSFKQAYIIIDAVDEASDDTRDHLLRALSPLRANLLLTSRPSNLSKHLPQDALFVYIDALNQQDIKHFIDENFQQSIRLLDLLEGKEEDGKEIRAELTEKSNGMYVAFVSECWIQY